MQLNNNRSPNILCPFSSLPFCPVFPQQFEISSLSKRSHNAKFNWRESIFVNIVWVARVATCILRIVASHHERRVTGKSSTLFLTPPPPLLHSFLEAREMVAGTEKELGTSRIRERKIDGKKGEDQILVGITRISTKTSVIWNTSSASLSRLLLLFEQC